MPRRKSPPESAVKQLLQDAAERLRRAGVDTPVLDAEVMLARALGCSRTELVSRPEYEPNEGAAGRFAELVGRRCRREPLAYLVGEKEFYGICFELTPAVLVPRPETEFLVGAVVESLVDSDEPVAADIGVGSGAVAVSVAREVPDAVVYGTESSPAALEVALRNAERAGVHDRVHLLHGDLFEPLAGMSFDVIASNPPYIPTGEIEKLQPEIAKYEPRQALDGGTDGLDFYRRLTREAPACLKVGGLLVVEVGAGQSGSVKDLLLANGFRKVRSVRDYGGVERVVLGEMGGD